jgi:nucleoside-diphosphate-sugar epimerase
LVTEGYDVTALVRARTRIKSLLDLPIRIFEYRGSTEDLVEHFKRESYDLVIHLAAKFLVQHKPNDLSDLIDSNVKFPTHLLEAMSQSKTKMIINTTSSWLYFHSDNYVPTNLYAATKKAFEAIESYYIEAHSFKVLNLMLYDTYGPNDNRRKILNLLKDTLKSNQKIEVSPSQQKLDLVYIDDVIEGYLQAIKNIEEEYFISGQTFSLCTESPIKLLDLIRLMGVEKNVIIGGRPYREREVQFPSYPHKRLPNWNPKTGLESGLKLFLSDL